MISLHATVHALLIISLPVALDHCINAFADIIVQLQYCRTSIFKLTNCQPNTMDILSTEGSWKRCKLSFDVYNFLCPLLSGIQIDIR